MTMAMKETAGMVHSDQHQQTIEEIAQAELRKSSYPAVREVFCERNGDVLTLRGRAPDFYQKQIAQSLVMHRLEGTVIIDNQVEVEPY